MLSGRAQENYKHCIWALEGAVVHKGPKNIEVLRKENAFKITRDLADAQTKGIQESRDFLRAIILHINIL